MIFKEITCTGNNYYRKLVTPFVSIYDLPWLLTASLRSPHAQLETNAVYSVHAHVSYMEVYRRPSGEVGIWARD